MTGYVESVDRRTTRIPSYTDWFNDYIKRNRTTEPPSTTLPHFWGVCGIIPKNIIKIWEEAGIDEINLDRLVTSIQISIADSAQEIWIKRCRALFAKRSSRY